jgi:DNA adenine methylase Dam
MIKIKESFFPAPLNYTGGKHKLLPQIIPMFPDNIDTFIDLFCGGCSVGLNISANKIVFNDKNAILIGLYNSLKNLDKQQIFEFINTTIVEFGLSQSCKNGYDYYECNGVDGLSKFNQIGYNKLRDKFNNMLSDDRYRFVTLYVLIVFCFNNQIRFNKNSEFNMPVGKRDFNKNMQNKLSNFIDLLHTKDYTFSSKDFREVNVFDYGETPFVYVDPPYLITTAQYNEQNGWTSKDESDLLSFLDNLNNQKIKFALSNVLTHKRNENSILRDWVSKNGFTINHLSKNYSNCNYHAKFKTEETDEVLIVNYKKE